MRYRTGEIRNYTSKRKEMRYRTGEIRNYTSKRKDTEVTDKHSTNTLENKPQPTYHNAAYKMINVHVDKWYELINMHYREHLHESYHISGSDITDKSGAVLLETQIKAELRQRNSVNITMLTIYLMNQRTGP